jgi:hypothetical protein
MTIVNDTSADVLIVVDEDRDGYDAETDCDDHNFMVYPGAIETCNGIDDDCDGSTDECVTTTYYLDVDIDGYGDPAVNVEACNVPTWYVQDNTDCNDNNPAVNPDATETCDGEDEDCDGQVDESAGFTWYADTDGDGFGNPDATSVACDAPSGYVQNGNDCDDSTNEAYPGATEVCDGNDENCDGQVDEDCV